MKDRIKAVILRHTFARELMSPTATLEDDLGIDSLDRVELSILLEEEFSIDIEADAVAAWSTVQDVIETVENVYIR